MRRVRNIIISTILTLTASGSILASVVVPAAVTAAPASNAIAASTTAALNTYYRG